MTVFSTHYTGLVDKYRDRLPLAADTRAVSLCEGETPLIRLPILNIDAELDQVKRAILENLS